ncbi:MAG: Ldh family oxidoreductase [Planctomycetia bacterium]|nr:Ldh family oxidoreductase [Planctomycetia bacterium]
MPTLSAEALLTFSDAMFRAAGVPPAEATQVARSLVDANLCGFDSHGVIRVVQYIDLINQGVYQPGAQFEVIQETPAVLVVDANRGLGQVQAHELLKRLMDKARQVGLAAGTLRHCAHIGRLGEYAEAAAAQRMAFMSTVNSHGHGRRVSPPGGTQGRLSTNPLCLGAPTAGDPVVLDIGTSVCAEGKVRVCFNKGERTPEGWLLDAEGKPTTDPSVLYQEPRGSILPLGGAQAYKGFGLSLLLDMLAGGLSGGQCSNPTANILGYNAVLFVVFDTAKFAGTEHFLNEVNGLADFVRTCPKAAGVQEIMLPGDPERKQRAQRQAKGLSVDDGTWSQLTTMARKLNVPTPTTY